MTDSIMNLISKLQNRLEIFRLEQRYTRRKRRTTFYSDARYVDGEYITPSSSAPSSSPHSRASQQRSRSYAPATSNSYAQNHPPPPRSHSHSPYPAHEGRPPNEPFLHAPAHPHPLPHSHSSPTVHQSRSENDVSVHSTRRHRQSPERLSIFGGADGERDRARTFGRMGVRN